MMSVSLLILAQLEMEPDALEITPGRVIAGLLVMSTLAASVAMIVLWAIRLKEQGHIFPMAKRKPLYVPLPLMIGGLALSGLMALMTIGQSSASADNDSNAASPELEVAESDQLADAEQTTDTEAATAAEDNDTAVSADETTADSSSEKSSAADVEQRFIGMVVGTLLMNAMMFAVFGISVFLLQQTQNRSVHGDEDLAYSLPAVYSPTVQSHSRFPDLDGPAETTEGLQLTTAVSTGALPEPEEDDDDEQTEHLHPELERWHFPTEFRFAFETFLAAYLPTAVLRIFILLLLPEAPSHPFLEMMEEGISWTLISLIALMAVVVAPIVEELLYRVTILGGLMQQRSVTVGWILSSVLFSFAHGFPDSLALLPLAFAIGYTYIRRRSYRTVMLVHFLFNTFNMAIAGITMV